MGARSFACDDSAPRTPRRHRFGAWVSLVLVLSFLPVTSMKAQSDLPERVPENPEGGVSQTAGVRVAVIDAKLQRAIEAGAETLRVFVVLRSQPHREVLERYEGPAKLWLAGVYS